MTNPCDKGPVLDKIEKKLDRLYEITSTVAVQTERLNSLHSIVENHSERIRAIEAQTTRADGHEGRLKDIENQPGKFLFAALISTVAAAVSSIVAYIVASINH